MRPRFFITLEALGGLPSAAGTLGVEVSLPAADAHHARNVLRARPGEPCELVEETSGRLFAGAFLEVGRSVVVQVIEELPGPTPERSMLALVQAVPATRKVDEIIEKGTEVGIAWFVLVLTSGSPRMEQTRLVERAERWRRIAREAAKQSRQLGVPMVEAAASLEAAASVVSAAGFRSAVLTPTAERHLGDLLAAVPRDDEPGPVRIAVWVGPEGGWSDEELGRLTGAGAETAGLGRRILRTETAGPVAAAIARFALGDR